jgi:hypothetical protein
MQGAEMTGADGGGGDPASLVRQVVESSRSVSCDKVKPLSAVMT